jgi:nucleoid-associated protein YgaU
VKRLLIVMAILGLASVQAQDVELREDHPREYVVQEGDTLWDIASRFLTRPWQWPAIWQANPQIDNPHLIFPG